MLGEGGGFKVTTTELHGEREDRVTAGEDGGRHLRKLCSQLPQIPADTQRPVDSGFLTPQPLWFIISAVHPHLSAAVFKVPQCCLRVTKDLQTESKRTWC